MALFSLGSGVVVKQQVPYGVGQAFRLAEKLIDDYQNQGLKVELRETKEAESLIAGISNREGTKLQVQVALRSLEPGSEVTVTLTGKVHVGGMQGMFASDSKVRKIAKERVVALLKKIFDPSKTPVEAAPEPVPEEPISAETSTTEDSDDTSEDHTTSNSDEAEPANTVQTEAPSSPPTAAEEAPATSVSSEGPVVSDEDSDDAPDPVFEAPSETTDLSSESVVSEDSPNVDSIVVNAAGRSLEKRLTILKLMLDRGLITNDDFKWKKNELLSSI